METIARKLIKNAPYNPRTISEAAKKKLRASLKKHGLVQPLIWNKRNGHLVGGHQRIEILDSLERSQDYMLTVAVVDLDETQEKELNVVVNNTAVMGEFDVDKLEKMAKSMSAESLEGMGFDAVEMEVLIGETFADENDEGKESIETLEAARAETNRKKEEVKAKRGKVNADMKAKNTANDESEFYVSLVFTSNEKATAFMKAFELPPENRYQDGETLWNTIKERIQRG